MPKFKLICDHSCALDTHVVTHEFNSECLPDVLEHIQYFLKGAGYQINGTLDFISDDEYYGTPPAMYDETDVLSGHSEYYFDTERNK